MTVEEVYTRDVVTLRCDDSLDALMRALESSQDVFPVLEGQKLVGTVSEMDLIRVVGPTKRTFPFGPRKLVREGLVRDVEDVMTPRPATTRPDETLETAAKRMESLDIPQLVVTDVNGRLLGLLRGRDVYRALFKPIP